MGKVTFYGSRLRLARQRRGFSRAELEAKTGIDRHRLYEYEEDQRAPSETDVEAVAEATSFPVGFFYLGDPPQIGWTSLRVCTHAD